MSGPVWSASSTDMLISGLLLWSSLLAPFAWLYADDKQLQTVKITRRNIYFRPDRLTRRAVALVSKWHTICERCTRRYTKSPSARGTSSTRTPGPRTRRCCTPRRPAGSGLALHKWTGVRLGSSVSVPGRQSRRLASGPSIALKKKKKTD